MSITKDYKAKDCEEEHTIQTPMVDLKFGMDCPFIPCMDNCKSVVLLFI